MFLLNLSLPEFLALFSAISGVVVTLYLLSRSRRKQVVATLRFWTAAKDPIPQARRRRIQQPWSLLLQLLGFALLLLALGQLKFGNRELASRDHVLLLDSSSWMGASSGRGSRLLLDEARDRAAAWLRTLPASDRVMLVRVDGLPSPATGMETSRELIRRAMAETRPAASALNLDQAFLFAQKIRARHGGNGEIVYAGSGRVAASGVPTSVPDRLRALDVEGAGSNAGLVRIGVQRSGTDADIWDVFVAVRNYDAAPRKLPVAISFGGAPAGATSVLVKPETTESVTFRLRTRAAGWIEARLLNQDTLPDDNRAILEIPALKTLRVAVFTDDPDSLRPVLSAHPRVEASYYPTAQYKPDTNASLVVLDRFTPPAEPRNAGTLWIEPPDNAPWKTRARVSSPAQVSWRSDHEICAGIRTRNLRLDTAQVLSPGRDDISLALVEGGPVALVRPSKKAVVLGFHPGRSDLRFDLTTPLLIANILRWQAPDVFRTSEVYGSTVGAVTARLDESPDANSVRVLRNEKPLPFTIQGDAVRFYSAEPGIVRVLSGSREQVYSLALPEVGENRWSPPASVRRGLPPVWAGAVAHDLWQWLAIAGAVCFFIEWLMFGRRRGRPTEDSPTASGNERIAWRKAS